MRKAIILAMLLLASAAYGAKVVTTDVPVTVTATDVDIPVDARSVDLWTDGDATITFTHNATSTTFAIELRANVPRNIKHGTYWDKITVTLTTATEVIPTWLDE